MVEVANPTIRHQFTPIHKVHTSFAPHSHTIRAVYAYHSPSFAPRSRLVRASFAPRSRLVRTSFARIRITHILRTSFASFASFARHSRHSHVIRVIRTSFACHSRRYSRSVRAPVRTPFARIRTGHRSQFATICILLTLVRICD